VHELVNPRALVIVSISAWLMSLSACGSVGGPVDGKVLEQGTHKPIPAAIVIASWQGAMFTFVDSRHTCIHVETATTDQAGHYHIPLWTASPKPPVHDVELLIVAYKAGYEWAGYDERDKRVQYLKPFTGTKEERLNNMGRAFGILECGSPEEYRPVVEPLLRAMYEEAKSLATTDKDMERLENYLTAWEFMKFGAEAANQRREQRRLERMPPRSAQESRTQPAILVQPAPQR
jgi:hypothetical protein